MFNSILAFKSVKKGLGNRIRDEGVEKGKDNY